MTNGILSPHEATVIVSLTDPASDKPLSRIAELFANNFREDTSRVRAIFALRTLLGFESTTNGNALLPTSPEVIAMLFLLHIASSGNSSSSASTDKKDGVSLESKDFAAAALYEHLLRVEDLLRDDALLTEQRKYRAATVVGAQPAATNGKEGASATTTNGTAASSPSSANNNSQQQKVDPKQKTRDAIEQDAYRGHLLQKVFVVQCLLNNNKSTSSSDLVIDFSKRVSAICSDTTLDALENAVTAWGATPESRTQISDAISRLKICYERENQQSNNNHNNLCGINFANRAVSAIVPDNGQICDQAKKGTKHFLTTNAAEMGLTTSAFVSTSSTTSSSSDNNSSVAASSATFLSSSSTTVIAPHAGVVAPPVNRARIVRDARFLLPPSNPFVLDTTPHPAEWKEAKSLIETALSGTELTAQQLSKLTTLLSTVSGGGDSSSATNNNSNNGAKNAKNAPNGGKGGKGGDSNSNISAPTDLFPYVGLSPQSFGRIARANPKVAAAILNSCASRFASNNNSDLYMKELVDFTYGSNPDFCPTVVLAASKNGLVTASHLSTYVNRAKAYGIACINGKEKNDFLKAFCVALHQISEKTPLEPSDKSAVVSMLNGISELSDVAKLWS